MEGRLATTLPRVCAASILCVAGGLAAGCGGGGGGSAPPPPSASAPTITAHPQSQVVTTGLAATFSVTASGAGLSYQWNRNGAAIAGATSATANTGAVLNGGTNFTTDTLVAIADNGVSGLMVIGSK